MTRERRRRRPQRCPSCDGSCVVVCRVVRNERPLTTRWCEVCPEARALQPQTKEQHP